MFLRQASQPQPPNSTAAILLHTHICISQLHTRKTNRMTSASLQLHRVVFVVAILLIFFIHFSCAVYNFFQMHFVFIYFFFVLGFRFEQKLNTTKFRIYYLLVCKDMKRDNNNEIIVMNTKQQHTHGHWPAHNNTHINRHRVHQLFSSFYIYFSIFCLDFHPI